ncbi:uncharacterized protein LOC108156135 [Drosophila miranda]|uniref:uncharacterized protein LOC108156135 n=1 Tax=Drosophila miranda TaxID=7229 RepID=UPI0007E7C05B|nr:uncharacterized protein LOC108156135 [Drosophila miranda]
MAQANVSDPVPFLYLDLMADLLMHETKEIALEFERKAELIREQEAAVLQNAKLLIKVDQFVGDVKACTMKLEMDLDENEQLLAEAEKAASKLERSCSTFPANSGRIEPLTHHTYLDLLKQIESAKKMSEECNILRADFYAFGKETAERLAPANVIGQLIDYHNKALTTLEDQIEQLEGKVGAIATEYEEITEDLGISSLSKTYTCEMAKEVLAKDFCNDHILKNNR